MPVAKYLEVLLVKIFKATQVNYSLIIQRQEIIAMNFLLHQYNLKRENKRPQFATSHFSAEAK